MLLKPTVPLDPVIVKDTKVDVVDGYGTNVTFVKNCSTLMFPSWVMGIIVLVVVTIPTNVDVVLVLTPKLTVIV